MSKNDSQDIKKIIAEISSLHSDLGAFREGIEKIKNAPKEKGAHVVGNQHETFITELEEIAQKIEGLPKKWSEKTKN